uniref:Uncharacterized protein n=1 Tax=Vitis vinifera TaxID=29760 RepID=A5BIR5_VITVI|nr:hypothetical protein VITISV_004137 [Vitis vinifera]
MEEYLGYRFNWKSGVTTMKSAYKKLCDTSCSMRRSSQPFNLLAGKCQIQKSTKVVEGMKSSLHILTKKTFQYESKENEVLYAVVMKEVNLLDAGNISSIPNKATQLFNDVSDTTNRVA